MQKGQISVQTENIFPIIKKFLYSDQEIFLRELVSNAVDATSKLKTLSSKGEVQGDLGDLRIEILLDEAAKTLTIRDRGIGMSAEEVERYLNQVAFSSATEFLEKYKGDHAIIGHFGLGFYSAFMVARKVEVVTKSFRPDSQAVVWSCEGEPAYTLANSDKAERGTDVILHITDDNKEFLEKGRIEDLLNKYCKFLPVPIQFGTRSETVADENAEADAEDKEKTIEVPNIINDVAPLWRKNPSELKDEDYKAFYQSLHPFSAEPLFWIHLNIDYPFNLTGVLYFPPIGQNLDIQRNKIQLYSNQVYVTDNVSEIVPEFLTLLHGVIDSPDIPLNVSRSYLQSDRNVKRITNYITKKVAEKLGELFKNDRQGYEDKWKDIGVFVKYGMLSEDKFDEKAQKFALLKNLEGQYFTPEEYKEKVAPQQSDKHDKVVFLYTNDEQGHHGAIAQCQVRGYDVLLLDHVIDVHFVQHLERKLDKISFVRVDADTVDALIKKDEAPASVLSEEEQKQLEGYVRGIISDQFANVALKALSPEDMPMLITRPEFMRRMKEMQFMQGGGGFPDSYTVVVNTNHPIIAQKVLPADEAARQDMLRNLYDLALLGQQMLKGKDLTAFIQRNVAALA